MRKQLNQIRAFIESVAVDAMQATDIFLAFAERAGTSVIEFFDEAARDKNVQASLLAGLFLILFLLWEANLL